MEVKYDTLGFYLILSYLGLVKHCTDKICLVFMALKFKISSRVQLVMQIKKVFFFFFFFFFFK